MAVIKAVSSRASIGTVINYVTKAEKTEEKLISGINCTSMTAIDEMKATKELWNKSEGRQYKHFVQSFMPGEQVVPAQAHQIALELAQERFKGYEVLVATHMDKEHIHSHIIVNSVSFEDGRKFQQSRAELQELKDHSDEICKKNNLSICEKGQDIATYDIGKYKALERATQGEYKSYVLDTAIAVLKAKEQATSRGNFVELMAEQGYNTNWSDSRKYITFKDKNGNKVRNSNLKKTFKVEFGKEQLENEFKRNSKREEIRNNSERTVARTEQTEPSRIGEQPTERELDGVHSVIREIEERAERFSPTARAEARERQRAEQAKRDKLAREQREKAERAEQQRKQFEKQQQTAVRSHRSHDRGFER
ncbi:MAG: relaxase/mobilization nuclease domain-containing protein [Oscillospiraceae bacterium]